MWWALLGAALALPPAYLGPDGPAWLGPLPPTVRAAEAGLPWLDLVVVVAPETGALYLQERDNAEVVRIWDGKEWTVAGAPITETWPARADLAYRLSGGQLVAVGGVGGDRRLRYDAAGNLIEASWPDGARLRVRYDAQGRVVEVSGPWLSRWRLDWDPDRLTATDDLGRTTTLRCSAQGVTEVQDAVGRIARSYYDAAGTLIAWEDPRGLQGRIQRDGEREIIQGGDGRVWTLTRDEAGAVVRLDAPGGAVWRWERLTPGGPIRAQVDPTGRVVRWERDAQGRVVGVLEGGAATRYERDEDGRVIGITDPSGASTRLSRDSQGRIVAITDAVGARIAIERYDGGLPMVIHSRTDGRWTLGLDLLGRPDRLEDPTGRVIVLQRGAGGRITRVTDRRFGETRLERGPTGALSRVTDPDGAQQGFVRDAAGRVVQVRMPDGQTWRLERDILGDLAAIERGGQRTALQRDTAGRPLQVGEAVSWRWATAGGVEQARAGALALDVRHDLAGRLEATAAGGWWLQIARDLVGRPVAWEGSDGAIQVIRDPAGHILAEESAARRVTVGRDLRGLLERASLEGRSWRWLRDAAGRILRRIAPGELLLGVDRDEAGRAILQRLTDGTLLRRRWVESVLVERVERPDGSLLVEQLTQLDALERVRWLQIVGSARREILYAPDGSVAVVQMPPGEVGWSWDSELLQGPGGTTLLLDEQGRLLEARPPQGVLAWGVGEALLSAFWGEDGRLAEVVGDHGGVRLEHDSLGRLSRLEFLDGQAWRLRYDARGRLAAVLSPGGEEQLLWSPEALSRWWQGEHGAEGLLASGPALERSHLFSEEGVWLDSAGSHTLWTRDRLQRWRADGGQPLTPMGLPIPPSADADTEASAEVPLDEAPASEIALSDDGGIVVFPGGPVVIGGVGLEPLSGQRTDGRQAWPWAPRGPRAEVRDRVLDPALWAPQSTWGEPLTMLVALGVLEPLEAEGWSEPPPEPAAVEWLPPSWDQVRVPLSVSGRALPLAEDPITMALLWAMLPGGVDLAPERVWETILAEEQDCLDLPPEMLMRGVLSGEG